MTASRLGDPMSTAIEPLTEETLVGAASMLAARDPVLNAIIARHGMPPLWPIEPGYGGLITIILGQQVSVSSARAASLRLVERVGTPTPDGLLGLDDAAMLAVGFSRQKTAYARELARQIVDGRLDLDALARLSDDQVRTTLIEVRGIGRWSADIYLLMALRRPDIWPSGDLALNTAVRERCALAEGDGEAEVERCAEAWRPWRSVAARILWMDYLRNRGREL